MITLLVVAVRDAAIVSRYVRVSGSREIDGRVYLLAPSPGVARALCEVPSGRPLCEEVETFETLAAAEAWIEADVAARRRLPA